MPQTIKRKAKDFSIPQEYVPGLSRLLPGLHFVVEADFVRYLQEQQVCAVLSHLSKIVSTISQSWCETLLRLRDLLVSHAYATSHQIPSDSTLRHSVSIGVIIDVGGLLFVLLSRARLLILQVAYWVASLDAQDTWVLAADASHNGIA